MDVFRQGKEEKPGWKWVVQKQPTNKQRTFYFFGYFHKSNSVLFFFVFSSIKSSFAPLQTCWDKSGVLLLLAPFH